MKKFIEILTVICFAAALAAVPIKTFSQPAAERLFYENRKAQPIPRPNARNLLDGSFQSSLEKGFSDNFVFRDSILAFHTYIDKYILRKKVINDVIWTEDESPLLPRISSAPADIEEIKSKAERMSARMSRIRDITAENGGEFYFVGIPEQYSYFRSKYPDYVFNNDDFLSQQEDILFRILSEKGINYIDMNEEFDKSGRSDSFYSFVDHHFTLKGAYETCKCLTERILSETDKTPALLSETDFEYKEVPNPYYGSRNRKLMGVYESKEHLFVPEFKERVPFLRTDNNEVRDSVIYNYFMDETAPITYETYMGGDIAETKIETHREDLPDLLMFGDSFTNPMEMLLYTSFDESRFLDFRYYDEKSLSEYIKEYKPDIVVMVRDDTRYLDFTGNGKLL